MKFVPRRLKDIGTSATKFAVSVAGGGEASLQLSAANHPVASQFADLFAGAGAGAAFVERTLPARVSARKASLVHQALLEHGVDGSTTQFMRHPVAFAGAYLAAFDQLSKPEKRAIVRVHALNAGTVAVTTLALWGDTKTGGLASHMLAALGAGFPIAAVSGLSKFSPEITSDVRQAKKLARELGRRRAELEHAREKLAKAEQKGVTGRALKARQDAVQSAHRKYEDALDAHVTSVVTLLKKHVTGDATPSAPKDIERAKKLARELADARDVMYQAERELADAKKTGAGEDELKARSDAVERAQAEYASINKMRVEHLAGILEKARPPSNESSGE